VTFCWGSYGRHGECGHSYGRGLIGRHDRRDRSIMTARRCCRFVFRGHRGVAQTGGCFAGACARVGGSPTETAGPASKVRGRDCPFKTACRALVRDFAFPSSSSSHACPLRFEFFRISNTTALCASSPPKTPLSRCRTGRVPTLPASSSSILSRRDNFLHSPPPSSGRSPATSPCRTPKGFVVSFVAFHERGFSVPASQFIRGVLFEYGLQL
jgi:hypothetical protein